MLSVYIKSHAREAVEDLRVCIEHPSFDCEKLKAAIELIESVLLCDDIEWGDIEAKL